MKNLTLLAATGLLAACATTQQGPAAYGYRPGESAATLISETEYEQSTATLLDLYNQRNTLAQLIGTTSDPARRATFARDIDKLNAAIAPIEYRLRAAHRPLPGGR